VDRGTATHHSMSEPLTLSSGLFLPLNKGRTHLKKYRALQKTVPTSPHLRPLVGGYHLLPSLRYPSACADSAEKFYLRGMRWRRAPKSRKPDMPQNAQPESGPSHKKPPLSSWTLTLHRNNPLSNSKANKVRERMEAELQHNV
jgi:hypothetical protein